MEVREVGRFRFCPACARPVMLPMFDSEDQDAPAFDPEDVRCSCCERPWPACPCTPASEGICRAAVEPLNAKE